MLLLQDVWPVCRHGSLCPCPGRDRTGLNAVTESISHPRQYRRNGQSSLGSFEMVVKGTLGVPSSIEGTALVEYGPWIAVDTYCLM